MKNFLLKNVIPIDRNFCYIRQDDYPPSCVRAHMRITYSNQVRPQTISQVRKVLPVHTTMGLTHIKYHYNNSRMCDKFFLEMYTPYIPKKPLAVSYIYIYIIKAVCLGACVLFIFYTDDTVTERPGVGRIGSMDIRIFLPSEPRILRHLFEKSFLLDVYPHNFYIFRTAFCRMNTHVCVYGV